MKLDDDIALLIAEGNEVPEIDMCGENAWNADTQANQIAYRHFHDMVPVLKVLITKIQQQQKAIEMFEYNQKWRKRRP